MRKPCPSGLLEKACRRLGPCQYVAEKNDVLNLDCTTEEGKAMISPGIGLGEMVQSLVEVDPYAKEYSELWEVDKRSFFVGVML